MTSAARSAKQELGRSIPPEPGTYALLLQLPEARQLQIGRLGSRVFDAPYYLYLGSAFGPGGLAARLRHHISPAARPHWHIDHLRPATLLVRIWLTTDERRLECAWAEAARALRGAEPVPGFGASDCRCESHLVALPRRPARASFRRQLGLDPSCDAIREIVADPDPVCR